jgi:hypothetical protein
MSAFGGKADIDLTPAMFAFDPKPTFALHDCCCANWNPETHFTDPKSLLQLFLIAACRDTQGNE